MVLSALESTELALESGLRKDQIIISCKTSRPRDLIAVYRDAGAPDRSAAAPRAHRSRHGHEGARLVGGGDGRAAAAKGIGDTIRVSLTPRPGGDRREEVYAACELLQALGLRSFSPSVTACPGCGRTTSTTFQELAERDPGLRPRAGCRSGRRARGRRDDDARRDGLRRQRPGRIEGGEHRHQPARHRRSAELPRLHRRPSTPRRCAAPTTSSPRRSSGSSTTTSTRSTRERRRAAACVRPVTRRRFFPTTHASSTRSTASGAFPAFRPLQREAMHAILARRDSVVVLPTGGGKSLCFQAPALVGRRARTGRRAGSRSSSRRSSR